MISDNEIKEKMKMIALNSPLLELLNEKCTVLKEAYLTGYADCRRAVMRAIYEKETKP